MSGSFFLNQRVVRKTIKVRVRVTANWRGVRVGVVGTQQQLDLSEFRAITWFPSCLGVIPGNQCISESWNLRIRSNRTHSVRQIHTYALIFVHNQHLCRSNCSRVRDPRQSSSELVPSHHFFLQPYPWVAPVLRPKKIPLLKNENNTQQRGN